MMTKDEALLPFKDTMLVSIGWHLVGIMDFSLEPQWYQLMMISRAMMKTEHAKQVK